MIKVNLAVKRESFKAPVVLGIDLAKVKWPVLLAAFAIYTFIPDFFSDYWKEERADMDQALVKKNKELRKITRDINSYGDLKGRLEAYNQQVENLKERSLKVEEIIRQRTNPHYILETVARGTPEGIWFEALVINKERELSILGKAREYRFLQQFITNLNNSPYFPGKMSLASSNTVTEKEDGQSVRLEEFTVKGRIGVFDPFNEQ